MLTDRTTLAQFLIAEQRNHPDTPSDLKALVLDLALACKVVSWQVAQGAISRRLTPAGEGAGPTDSRSLDDLATSAFLRAVEGGGSVAGLRSFDPHPSHTIPPAGTEGRYLVVFDPLEGASSIDGTVSVGSIFSILGNPHPGTAPSTQDYLQAGSQQVAAGYALYGPATIMVLTLRHGVHGFTLDPTVGEFFLTHPGMAVSEQADEFAINHANRRFWEPAVRRYVDECLAGASGSRGRNFTMHWVDSLVAETHRVLVRGGVCLHPCGSGGGFTLGDLRVLDQANPIGLLIEEAGGRASTGHVPMLDHQGVDVTEQSSFVFGSRHEVERIERYQSESYDEPGDRDLDLPLYASRGLFRPPFPRP